MKVHINHLDAVIEVASKEELMWLRDKLTWREKEKERTLLRLVDGKFCFLAGLIPHINAPFRIEVANDREEKAEVINCATDELYSYQVAALKKIVMLKWGLAVMPTGSGKTRVAIALVKHILHDMSSRITVITPTVTIATQFAEMMIKLGIKRDIISVLYANEEFRNTPVLVGVVNSLFSAIKKNNSIKEHIANSIAVISDEAHHSKATMYYSVISHARSVRYCIGLTGTPFQNENPLSNIDDAIVLGIYRRMLFKLSHSYLYQNSFIAKPYVCFISSDENKMAFSRHRWETVYTRYIVNNYRRNKKAIEIINRFVKRKMLVLVLVQRLAHAEKILQELDCRAIVVFGGSVGLEKDENGLIQKIPINYDAFRESFENRIWDVAIMSQVGDEGIDLASIDALIMIGAGKSRIKLFQRVGRGMRKKEKNNIVYIIDFWDRSHIYLFKQSKKRKLLYEEMNAVFLQEEFMKNML